MGKKVKRKFRSVKRKKRRGFYSQRPAELHKSNKGCESTCDAVPGPSCASSPVGKYKLPLAASTPVKENVSARKLKNSSFEEIEREHGIMTRKKAKRVGVESSSQVEHAVGFKLHDAMLLNEYFHPCNLQCMPKGRLHASIVSEEH